MGVIDANRRAIRLDPFLRRQRRLQKHGCRDDDQVSATGAHEPAHHGGEIDNEQQGGCPHDERRRVKERAVLEHNYLEKNMKILGVGMYSERGSLLLSITSLAREFRIKEAVVVSSEDTNDEGNDGRAQAPRRTGSTIEHLRWREVYRATDIEPGEG